jgi:hypothetical protein
MDVPNHPYELQPRKPMNRLLLLSCFAVLLLLTTAAPEHASAQNNPVSAAAETVAPPEARPSPLMLAQSSLADGTYLKVVYSSPRKRGRDIFGGLVPYGEVWRLGANEATEMIVTEDVMFGGKPLEAGTYALFALPEQDTWTIIVNRGLGQWGAFSYDPEQDVLRVEAPAETIPQSHEAFTIALEEAGEGANLAMMWDQTKVSIPIQAQ